MSLFENGKYLLPDSDLEKLRDYYESHGAVFDDDLPTIEPADANREDWTQDENPQYSSRGVCHLDGFIIPPAVDESLVESILSEYSKNLRKIRKLCNSRPKEGFLWGIDEEDLERREQAALALMVRNYTLIEQLHGRETVVPRQKEEKETIGYYVAQVLAEAESE